MKPGAFARPKSGTSVGRSWRPGRMLVPAASALLLATTACSAATATSPPSTTTSSTVTTTSTAAPKKALIAGYITIDGRKVAVPDEGTRPIQAIEDVGEQINITPKAIEPHLLFCQVKYRLTFTNLTSVPQRLKFVNDGGWRSPVIPPGQNWHFTPIFGISYYYVSNTGLQATFQASAPIPGNP